MSKTNYNKMYDDPIEEIEELEEMTEEVVEEVVEDEPEFLMGKVVDCPKLNIRVAPVVGATIVKEIAKDAEVMVYLDESTDDFYKVCTESGAEGFCMKKYIAV